MNETQPVAPLADLLLQAPPLGAWVEDARCAGLDAFTADDPRAPDVAMLERVCRKCPVRVDCGLYADRSRSLGMWGGVFRSSGYYRRSEAA